MDAPKGKRVMSAKEFREYADECIRSAKMAKSVKERRDFLQKAEAWLQAADLWRPHHPVGKGGPHSLNQSG
jgi:hypothetical protein